MCTQCLDLCGIPTPRQAHGGCTCLLELIIGFASDPSVLIPQGSSRFRLVALVALPVAVLMMLQSHCRAQVALHHADVSSLLGWAGNATRYARSACMPLT